MNTPLDANRLGFVVKRYPRYSETFFVREILAHEAAGVAVFIYALQQSEDAHFQEIIARVRAPVSYLRAPRVEYRKRLAERREPLTSTVLAPDDLWIAAEMAAEVVEDLWCRLEGAREERADHIYAALVLAREVRLKGIHHLHAGFSHTPATVARLAANLAGVTYSFTARAKDIFHRDTVQHADLTRKLADASAAITITDYNREYLKTTYGHVADRVRRIYNGLDLPQFPFKADAIRPPRILAVGRYVEKKGFSDLVEACGILVGRGLDFECRIVGSGPLRETLRNQIDQLGLGCRITLVGPRPQMDVIEEMQTAAVFCLPCIVADDGDRDGLPNVLFESMALGTPCVSTSVVGIPELVQDGCTGLLVPERDPVALADALAKLLADADLRKRLAVAARRLIEDEFDAHRNAALRRSLYFGSVPSGTEVGQESERCT